MEVSVPTKFVAAEENAWDRAIRALVQIPVPPCVLQATKAQLGAKADACGYVEKGGGDVHLLSFA